MSQFALLAVLAAASLGRFRPSPDVEVRLGGERAIRGAIMKETPDELFVDVGYTILAVPRESVVEVVELDSAGEEVAAEAAGSTNRLYFEMQRPETGVRENVHRVEEGIVLVQVPGAQGSGFVIDERGHVVTNAHVVEGEQRISLTFFTRGERGFERTVVDEVQIVAVNPYWDLALLRIPQADNVVLRPLPIGRPRDLQVGQPVFALGNPLGLERSVSEGIVSSRNRAAQGMLYVQTTAPINPGNSGGPLLDLEGQVIGVVTWQYLFSEGLNFAIPVSTLRAFLDDHDAFAFSKDTPNAGYRYLEPPRKGGEPD